MWGLNKHVSAPKSNTDWTTALKKNMDTHVLAPSLLRILNNLCQTVYAFARIWTTAGQSSSTTDSTLLRYLKDGTILRR